MTVYELIQALAYYPANAEVSVKISNNTKLDISDINTEYQYAQMEDGVFTDVTTNRSMVKGWLKFRIVQKSRKNRTRRKAL